MVPPAGSYGASTGIADAHNLAWKLVAVLAGRAGAALLDTYETERRPVAEATLRTALQQLRTRHTAGGQDIQRIDDLAMIFGYRYESPAVPGAAAGDPVADPRTPTGEPGLRTPHVRLVRDGVELSTTDLCTGEFTLLTGPDGAEWATAADVTVLRVGVDVEDPDDRFLTSFGLTSTGATLVRPDGFVAWRAITLPAAPEQELRQALAELLAVPMAQGVDERR